MFNSGNKGLDRIVKEVTGYMDTVAYRRKHGKIVNIDDLMRLSLDKIERISKLNVNHVGKQNIEEANSIVWGVYGYLQGEADNMHEERDFSLVNNGCVSDESKL